MLPNKQPITTRATSMSSCFMSCIRPQLYMHDPFAIFLVSGLVGLIFSTFWHPDDSQVYHTSVNNINDNNNVEPADNIESNNGSEHASSNGYVHIFHILVRFCVLSIPTAAAVIPIINKIDGRRRHDISSTQSQQKLQQHSSLNRSRNKNHLCSIVKFSRMRLISLHAGFALGSTAALIMKCFVYLRENDDFNLTSYMVILKYGAIWALFDVCKHVVISTLIILCYDWIYTRRIAVSDKNESDERYFDSVEEDNHYDIQIIWEDTEADDDEEA